jgi:3-methyladenine DNA glycosylase AlkD
MATLQEFKNALYGEGYDPSSFKESTMVGTPLKRAFLTTPHVHAVVKEYRQDRSLPLASFPLDESVELTLTYFLLSLYRLPSFLEQMAFLEKKLFAAQSWIITDTLGMALKKNVGKDFHPFYLAFTTSKETYKKRFAYVQALRYYREPDVSFFLKHLQVDEEYYVMMGQAWMLATFAINHFQEVVAFLQNKDCPLPLKRKTISKCCDSYRLSAEEKEILKSLRDRT